MQCHAHIMSARKLLTLVFVIHRLSLGGPIVPETKQPALYKIPIIPVGESVQLHIGCFVQACGHLSVQPFVSLPVNMSGMPTWHAVILHL